MEFSKLLEKRDFYLAAKENCLTDEEIEKRVEELRAKLVAERAGDVEKIEHYLALLDELIEENKPAEVEAEATECETCEECTIEAPVEAEIAPEEVETCDECAKEEEHVEEPAQPRVSFFNIQH